MAVPVSVAVRDAVGENAGSDVWVAVGVAGGGWVGDFFGFLVFVGLWVGLARAALAATEESVWACTGIANRHINIRQKRNRKPFLYFIMIDESILEKNNRPATGQKKGARVTGSFFL